MNLAAPGLSTSALDTLRKEYGFNELPTPKEASQVVIFLRQFRSLLVYLLVLAAGVSLVAREYIDVVVILFIVFLNATISFIQEAKAKKEVAALKKLTVLYTRVIRDGKEQKIETKLLLPGDIVVVEAGDRIPADGVVLWEQGLTVSEASLTGESQPVSKKEQSEVFLSTVVLGGRAHFQVTKIGEATKFGQIALTLGKLQDEKTPLELKLADFSRKLALGAVALIVLMLLLGLYQGRPLIELILSSVALAVAAIPEGLPAVLTIALAIGTRRLADKKAIVKRLAVAEALGSVDVICTDKTGTLTKNEMVVEKIYLGNGGERVVTGVGYVAQGEIKGGDGVELKDLIKVGVVCSSASLVVKEGSDDEYEVLGDSTEGALLILAKKAGVDIEAMREAHPIKEEIPFDSGRKMMSVQTSEHVYAKGASESILKHCDLSEEKKKKILAQAKSWGEQGYRVLALAKKKINSPVSASEMETDLDFLGLVALADAPREEVRGAIATCQKLGITPIMVTGDSPETALAIAKAVGLTQEGGEVLEGKQVDEMSDEDLVIALGKVRVFSRVDPLQKLRIVSALQSQGKVVAVTGDGVNDAPALKKAQVGVAMGKIGTDVSKEASDLIITDDNFATIVTAIEEGRLIFANLTRSTGYLLASNIGEVLVVVAAMIFALPMPFSPLAILWINVISDGLPALALAVDRQDASTLTKVKQRVFIDWRILLGVSLLVALPSLTAFVYALQAYPAYAQEIVFTTLVIMEIFAALAVRGVKQKLFGNPLLLISFAVTLLAQGAILFVPFLHAIFF